MSVSACYQHACCWHPYYSIPPTILCGLTRALVSPLRYFKSRHFRYLRVGQCHSFFHRNKRKPKRMHSLVLVHLQILFTSKACSAEQPFSLPFSLCALVVSFFPVIVVRRCVHVSCRMREYVKSNTRYSGSNSM